ncbi:MAG: bacterial regulatory, arsR family protein [Nevskia sp.]|nr:bacterial regulatory, arsR family protein [Nevskia sp.]
MSNKKPQSMHDASDYIRGQGSAAIGARLRRLSERIDRDAARVYAEAGITVELRWVGALKVLSLYGPLSVGELATSLGISHVSVSQTRNSLEKAGLASSIPDQEDARSRKVQLTAAGCRMIKQLEPLWKILEDVAAELDEEANRVVAALDRLDAALDRSSLHERVAGRLKTGARQAVAHKRPANAGPAMRTSVSRKPL